MVEHKLAPLSELSQRAVRMVQEKSADLQGGAGSASSGLHRRTDEGSHPRKEAVSYKDVLTGLQLITLRPGNVGRKPSAGVGEMRKTRDERLPTHDWPSWWMQIGGFQADELGACVKIV